MADVARILIPLDGSKLAEHALAYVPALKPLGEAKFRLVSVVEGGDGHDRHSEAREREGNVMQGYLEEVALEVQAHTAVEVGTKLLSGSPATALMEEEKDFNADLLVISTHGASGISRWRFGSVTDKLIRGLNGSTMVIGPKAAEREDLLIGELTPAFRNILIPLDGSELAEKALPEAIHFASSFGASVHLVRAVSVSAVGADAASATAYWSEITDALTKEAADYLAEIAKEFPAGTTVETEVRMGGAADLLSEYISEHGIDLVIMTTHGRSGLARTALGSATDRLLGGEAPVLVVRPEA